LGEAVQIERIRTSSGPRCLLGIETDRFDASSKMDYLLVNALSNDISSEAARDAEVEASYTDRMEEAEMKRFGDGSSPGRGRARMSVVSVVVVVLCLAVLTGCGRDDREARGESKSPDPSTSTATAPTDPSTSASAETASSDLWETHPQDISFLGLPAPRRVALVARDMRKLQSAHLSVKVLVHHSVDRYEMDVMRSGDCQGTIKQGGGQGAIAVLAFGGRRLIRPDAKFWSAHPDAATMKRAAAGRWIVEDDMAGGGRLCDLDRLFGDLDDELDGALGGGLGSAETMKLPTDATPLSTTDLNVYVAVGPPHYVLLISSKGVSQYDMELSHFDEEFRIRTPRAADIYTP
jgi:hypothetical protein